MKSILFATLFAFLLCPTLVAQEQDIVQLIESNLPEGWECKMKSYHFGTFVVASSPEMSYVSSWYGSAELERGRIGKLEVCIKLLPRHSKEMTKRIEEYNEPILKQMEKYPRRKSMPQEFLALEAQLIELPTYQNASYGFKVEWPSRIPASEEDKEKLDKFLSAISADWEFGYSEEASAFTGTPSERLVRIWKGALEFSRYSK